MTNPQQSRLAHSAKHLTHTAPTTRRAMALYVARTRLVPKARRKDSR